MWAGTTSMDFSLAQLIQVIILLGTGGANSGGYLASKYVVLAIYGLILFLHGLINNLPIHWLSWFGHLGAFWNVAVCSKQNKRGATRQELTASRLACSPACPCTDARRSVELAGPRRAHGRGVAVRC